MNENTIWKILIIVLILLLLSDFIFYKSIYEKGYIDACKDLYQGKLKYDLVEFPDGTKEWKKIENN
jgi:hypothetical protein